VLVAQDGEAVAAHVAALDAATAAAIGRAARRRVLAEHTYAQRVLQLEALLDGRAAA
jgi:spore maturation protein CgeB